jgi:hypothetical protein
MHYTWLAMILPLGSIVTMLYVVFLAPDKDGISGRNC